MKPKRSRAAVAYTGLGLLVLLVASCDNGDKGTGPGKTPVVSTLDVRALSAETAGTRVRYEFTAIVSDPDNNLVGGQAEIRLLTARTKSLSQVIGSVPIDVTNLVTGRLRVTFAIDLPEGGLVVAFSIVDAAGNRSNEARVTLRPTSGGGGGGGGGGGPAPTPPTGGLSTVTIAATDPSAAEGSPADPGTFTVTRTAPLTAALQVAYAVSGTATVGTDYTLAPTLASVTIPAGLATATITVNPLNDALVEGSETVIATLGPSASYVVGTPASATVTIADDDSPTVTIAATDTTAAEPADPGVFTVTRTGSTAAPLTVVYTVSGTATPGSDYPTLPGSVTIPAGSTTATVTVTPTADGLGEPNETVILTLQPAAGYTVGSPSTATVTITFNST